MRRASGGPRASRRRGSALAGRIRTEPGRSSVTDSAEDRRERAARVARATLTYRACRCCPAPDSEAVAASDALVRGRGSQHGGDARHTATRAPARRRAPLRSLAGPPHRRRPARTSPRAASATSAATSPVRSWAAFSTASPADRFSWPSTGAAAAARRPSRNGSWRGCRARPSCTPARHRLVPRDVRLVRADHRSGAGAAAPRRGHRVPPARWDQRGRPGAVTVPAGCPLVVVEGVGIGRRDLAAFFDALVWVQADRAVAWARGLARDGGDPAQEAFWHEWEARGAPVPRRRSNRGSARTSSSTGHRSCRTTRRRNWSVAGHLRDLQQHRIANLGDPDQRAR